MPTLLLVLALLAGSQSEVARAPSAPDVAAPFEALELSARLARLGRERADPWLLAAAARLRLQTSVRADGPAAEAEAWTQAAQAWLDEAEAMGDDDPTLAAFIQSIRAEIPKGRSGGPRVSLERLAGGMASRREERFTPGATAVVYVEGDGDAPLGLRILSDDGVACSDDRPGDVKLCVWRAKSPGVYAVELRNLGRVSNRYVYGTN